MDGIVFTGAAVGDAPTTGRKSTGCQRIEVITRGERRRRWSVEQKREIVAASLQPDARVADIAAEHGINTGLVYTWRRQMLEGQLGEAAQPAPSFARVEIARTAEPPAPPRMISAPAVSPGPLPVPAGASVATGRIEITLPSGIGLRVDADVDSRALRRVLAALDDR